MFIKLFRTESAMQAIILLLTGILLWMKAFAHPVPMPDAVAIAPFYSYIQKALNNLPWLITLLGLFLLFSEAILLNLILTNQDLAPRNSLLPAIIYVLFMSWSPQLLTLHPILFTNAFLIFTIYTFFKVYEQPDAFKEVFSSTFALALATFFNLPAAALMVMIWFGLIIYRVFSWREWSISILGFCIPYLFLATYYFWFDRIGEIYLKHLAFIHSITWMNVHFDWITALLGILLGLFLLLSIVRILDLIQEKVISIRKKFLIIFWFVAAIIPAVLFSGKDFISQMSMLLLPASILISYYFTIKKKLAWLEVLFTIFLFLLVLIRLY